MHFDHRKNKFRFSFFYFFIFYFLFYFLFFIFIFFFCLSHRLYRGSEVMVGPKDPFQYFLKYIFVQDGSMGIRFDHFQFEIKTLTFTPALLHR